VAIWRSIRKAITSRRGTGYYVAHCIASIDVLVFLRLRINVLHQEEQKSSDGLVTHGSDFGSSSNPSNVPIKGSKTMNYSYSRVTGFVAISIATAIFIGFISSLLTLHAFDITPLLAIRSFVITIAALLNIRLIWMLQLGFRTPLHWFSRFMLITGLIGSFIVFIGSAFDFLNTIVGHNLIIWFPLSQTQSIIAVGFAFIGIWLLLLNYQARLDKAWSHRLAWLGIIAGTVMATGLLAIPRIFIPYVSLYHEIVPELGELVGLLGWLFLYPSWCMWLGFVYRKGMYVGRHQEGFSPRFQ
jgi:hypothetical protein